MDVVRPWGYRVLQVLGRGCRISSATPILAPALGFAGVGLAAAAVGQSARYTRHWFATDPRFPLQRSRGKRKQGQAPLWQPADLAMDAVIGLLAFKVPIACAHSVLHASVVHDSD